MVVAMHVHYGARVTFGQSGGIYNNSSTVARDLWRTQTPGPVL